MNPRACEWAMAPNICDNTRRNITDWHSRKNNEGCHIACENQGVILIQHGTSRHDWAARVFSAHLSSPFDITRIWTLDLDISRHPGRRLLHRFREPLPPPPSSAARSCRSALPVSTGLDSTGTTSSSGGSSAAATVLAASGADCPGTMFTVTDQKQRHSVNNRSISRDIA